MNGRDSDGSDVNRASPPSSPNPPTVGSHHIETIEAAIKAVAASVVPVPVELCGDRPLGRVLAAPIRADRDSPAADVSAMDGYAIVGKQLSESGELPVVGESRPGHAPP